MTKFKAGDKVWDKELEKIVTLKKFIREIISHEPSLHFIRYWEVEEDTENLYAEYNLTDTADTMLTRLGFEKEKLTYVPRFGHNGSCYYCFDKSSKYYGMYIAIDLEDKEYVVGTQIDNNEAEVEWINLPLHNVLNQLMVEMEAIK